MKLRALLIALAFASLAHADPVRLHRLAPGAWKASFSPDGKRIVAGRSGAGLDMIDVATGLRRRFVPIGKDPAWSPDGRYIAFVDPGQASNENDETVWLIDPQGHDSRRLVKGGYPSWKADGKTLWFSTRPEGHVYSIDVDDPKGRVRLFYDAANVRYPAITARGDRLAFVQGGQLRIVDPRDGTAFIARGINAGREILGSWSPDGRYLAFGSAAEPSPGIFIYRFDPTLSRQVIHGPFTMPVWSPDGQTLAFDMRLGDAQDVWLRDARDIVQSAPVGGLPPLEADGAWHARDQLLPELAHVDLDRRVWRLDDMEGDHLLFVTLWSTTCKPAREQLALVQTLSERLRGHPEVMVITLNADADPARARRFATAMNLTVPVIPAAAYVHVAQASDFLPRSWIIGRAATSSPSASASTRASTTAGWKRHCKRSIASERSADRAPACIHRRNPRRQRARSRPPR
jgi:sugar lactone lactonase YvrE